MATAFKTKAFGKWILAGEHAVLRGCPALVFPLKSRALSLSFEPGSAGLKLELSGRHGQELELLFWTVLDRACTVLKISRSELHGHIKIDSAIPVGAGMGASATLCVALTRWLGHLGYVKESDYYEFARGLENLFHGESSGVDIAVALSGEGLKFLRNGPREVVAPAWQPKLYISYCGQRGVTVDCVNQVKALLARDPETYQALDTKMAESVALCEMALLHESSSSFLILKQALEMAEDIFVKWGLTEGSLSEHMRELKSAGALAVKPTGSGGGGYALSLWQGEVPQHLQDQLIPCF